MIPGDRLYCALVESLKVGDTFTNWPLHVTLVPWFRTDISSARLSSDIQRRLQAIKPFTVSVAGEERFGAKRRTVNLVAEPTLLVDIEHIARGQLYELGAWIVDETTEVRQAFRPHVTEQAATRLHAGDIFRCDALYIVEQKGDYKEIVSRVML